MATGNGQPRTYDRADPLDIPSGEMKGQQLIYQIGQDPALAALNVDRIDGSGTLFSIFFDAPLTASEITALDAVVFAHAPVPTIGGFQFFESNAAQLISVQAWQDVFVATTQALQKGTYIVTWNAECRVVPVGGLNSACQGRVRFRDSNKGLFSWQHEAWQTHSGWDRQRFEAGEITDLIIQFRRDPDVGGNDDVEIRRMKLGIELKED